VMQVETRVQSARFGIQHMQIHRLSRNVISYDVACSPIHLTERLKLQHDKLRFRSSLIFNSRLYTKAPLPPGRTPTSWCGIRWAPAPSPPRRTIKTSTSTSSKQGLTLLHFSA
jgi:hypothetical protein